MKSSPRIQLASVVAFAVVWRALMLFHYEMIDTDAAYYGAVTRFFAAGHWERGLDPIWPPFYPLLVSVPARLGLPLEASGVLVSFLASVGCVVCCYFLARLIAGPRVALVAAVVAAVHPRLVIISQSLLTESLYVFLAGTALAVFGYSFTAARRAATGKVLAAMFLSGVVLALAFLTRPEGVVFFVLLLTLTVAHAVHRLSRGRSGLSSLRSVLVPVLLCAGFLTPSLPYLYDVSRTEGRWIPGEKGSLNFYLTYREAYKEEGIAVQPSDYAAITGVDSEREPGSYNVGEFVRRRPGMFLGRLLDNLPKALFNKIPSLMYWPLMLLSIAGIVYRRQVPRSNYEWLFGVWILLIAMAISPFFLMRRFFVAALPPLIVWSAIGIEELRRRMPPRAFAASAAVAVVAFCLYSSYSLDKISWPLLYKEAGTWLRRNATSPVVIAGRKPEVSFYAESEFRPIDVQKIESLEAYMRSEQITHLVAEDYIMPSTHPDLAYLIDPRKAPGWLTPVFSAARDGHALVLYEYTPAAPR